MMIIAWFVAALAVGAATYGLPVFSRRRDLRRADAAAVWEYRYQLALSMRRSTRSLQRLADGFRQVGVAARDAAAAFAGLAAALRRVGSDDRG